MLKPSLAAFSMRLDALPCVPGLKRALLDGHLSVSSLDGEVSCAEYACQAIFSKSWLEDMTTDLHTCDIHASKHT